MPALVELAHAELELRLRAGEPARAEKYLERFPVLAAQPAVALDLIVAEFTHRGRCGSRPSLGEYLRRFPQWQEELAGRVAKAALPVPTSIPGDEPRPLRGVAPPGYEVLGELGRGGMGVVYKARQLSLGRIVALKMILSGGHAGEDEKRRFLAEAEAIARIRHLGIVQVYDYGTHGGLPYFSMEYCEVGSLADKLGGAPLPAKEAARLVEQVARAVQAAHEAGVVHRDLKPANVLLAADGQAPTPAGGLLGPTPPFRRGQRYAARAPAAHARAKWRPNRPGVVRPSLRAPLAGGRPAPH
jgi:serine/threonine-protein kinase